MTGDDIMKIVNLKHAWEFILNENVIWADLTDEYKKLLILYYERKDKGEIKKFLFEKCYMVLKWGWLWRKFLLNV